MCLPEANLHSFLLLVCSAKRWSPVSEQQRWRCMPKQTPAGDEGPIKTTQSSLLKTHPWHVFTHDFVTHGVHTWFSPLPSLNQVVCFIKASLVCSFDCVGANASEWVCALTHVNMFQKVCLKECVGQKKALWLHPIDSALSSALCY